MALTADQIMSADDIETRVVNVPEWGGDVIVKALTGRERDSYEASLFKQIGQKTVRDVTNFHAKLVVRALVDENGKALFPQDKAAELGKKSGQVLDRLFDIIREMSGMDDEDEDGNDKAVDAAAENLDDDPSDDSVSGSPANSDAQ